MTIPFNKATLVGNEEKYVLEALRSGKWAGRGPKTLALESLCKQKLDVPFCYFVTSGTAALEISMLVADVGPGDEVILPSFGFVSAANAVVLRGAKPVFADIDLESWNLSRETVEPLVNSKTKAVLTVHYAGSTEGIEELRDLCSEKKLFFIEDAAQSMGATRFGRPIGATPWTTCFSLHDTKNISSGEGGLIATSDSKLASRIEMIIEKGTDRQKFLRGQIDKYTWVELGSSFVASDLLAAVGLAQVEALESITSRRRQIEKEYRKGLASFAASEKIHFQKLSAGIEANGHVAGFRVEPKWRGLILQALKAAGVDSLFHYVPLHDAPFAKAHGFAPLKDLPQTRLLSEGLVRIPIHMSLTDGQVAEVVTQTQKVLQKTLA